MTFLLDEHISPDVAQICEALGHPCAVSLRGWRNGELLGQTDHHLLREAAKEGLILVTFDLATIPTLLQQWAIAGEIHAGVVLISTKTISQNDSPNIARALMELKQISGEQSWANRVVFLERFSEVS